MLTVVDYMESLTKRTNSERGFDFGHFEPAYRAKDWRKILQTGNYISHIADDGETKTRISL